MAVRPVWVGVRRGLVVGSCLLLASCKSPTTPTPTPPPPELTLSCPANQAGLSHFGQPAIVSWPDPVVTGGFAPVSYFCAPASGTPFVVGTSTVTCTALDGYLRRASCSFQVSVVRPPQLAATRFVAFGDSLTEGKDSVLCAPLPTAFWCWDAYPVRLQDMLSARYTDQAFTMFPEGLGGEKTSDGLARLPGVLTVDNPEVLLLQEGANDLLSSQEAAIPGIIASLRSMITVARARNVRVYLANQAPQRAGGSRARGAGAVAPLNVELATLARQVDVPLVDIFTPLNAELAATVDADGLHLTVRGYEVMAQAFFDSIRATLETRAIR
jgi:acyl-CoA thioesterase-1